MGKTPTTASPKTDLGPTGQITRKKLVHTTMRIFNILACIAIVATTTISSPYSAGAQDTTPRPIAGWNFDAGQGFDVAPTYGSLHGTLRGDAGWAAGLVGAHALTLSGKPGSYVDIEEPVVDTAHSYTVMACVKLNRTSGFQTFVSIDGNQISGFFLQFRDDTDEFAITVPPIDNTAGDAAEASSQVAPETGVWYHLAGV
jgi:hypothetical protein